MATRALRAGGRIAVNRAAGWQRDHPGRSAPSRCTSCTPTVYGAGMVRVGTNVEIEETYVEAIRDPVAVRTKTEAVALTLRHLVGRPTTRAGALSMGGTHAIGRGTAPRSGVIRSTRRRH